MGIDLSKMRAKLNAVQNRGGGTKKSQFWRPEDGEQTIRIVPTADGDPFKEFFFHYNLGKNAGFLSPKKNFGEDDPLDGFIRQLFNEGTEESTKMAKSLMARQRFFSPVIVRGEEEEGVKLWGYGKMGYSVLIQLVLNPDYGDITDVDGGTDLVINYGKPPGASFPVTKIHPRRRPSALAEDKDATQAYLDGIPSFKENFNEKTTEEIEEMLSSFLSGESTDNTGGSETTKYSNNNSSEATDVDEAFKELLS